MKLIVALTGASGAVCAVRLLEALEAAGGVETHLIVSDWGKETLLSETEYSVEYLRGLASVTYDCRDLGAKPSSGSFLTEGMVVLPCSMKTLSAIANGYDDNLISRAAGVTLKEGRRLVLCPRETPLSAIHLENMLKLARLGVSIIPPMPAFYNAPETIDDVIHSHITKVLDSLGIPAGDAKRWNDN
jgi:4-hydroxy-3-polyprenylbenzoate decarboxylase